MTELASQCSEKPRNYDIEPSVGGGVWNIELGFERQCCMRNRGTHFSRFWKFVGGGGFSHYFAACDSNDAKNIKIKGGLGVAN